MKYILRDIFRNFETAIKLKMWKTKSVKIIYIVLYNEFILIIMLEFRTECTMVNL